VDYHPVARVQPPSSSGITATAGGALSENGYCKKDIYCIDGLVPQQDALVRDQDITRTIDDTHATYLKIHKLFDWNSLTL
jgi:hypothetical protein